MSDVIHFKNFLGPRDSTLCGELHVPAESVTFDPEAVTCERCLAGMGRLRAQRYGLPTGKKPKP